jgi:predicted HTH transcriptional regulator
MNEYQDYWSSTGSITISNMSKPDLHNLVQMGETAFVEFKQKVASPEKLAREIAAFANCDGGMILIGVGDRGELIGLETYLEEEFWLQKAAAEECIPPVNITVELFQHGQRDILIVKVPEAEHKPVYVKGHKRRKVYVRVQDASVEASDEYIEVLKQGSSAEGVTFEYGEKEQILFRYLKEYSEITVKEFSNIAYINTYRASKILINLVSAGVLDLFERDGKAHYTFSVKTA